jgi:mannan endo-1,4-beta-mannosidase
MMQQGRKGSGRLRGVVITCVVIIAAVVVAAAITLSKRPDTGPLPVKLPTTPGTYLGVYAKGSPASYAGVTSFKDATGTHPDVLMYYSGWYEPFQTSFARKAASEGAVPLVQLDPVVPHKPAISLAAIAAGQYDPYLSLYAEAVRAYKHPVIMSFAHEMNGSWYPWGSNKGQSPKTYVAAWQHIVKIFRALRANNVTWMWTVNIINDAHGSTTPIPSPGPWWPGSAYVNWVGIDGYYLKPTWQFASLFGPTIAAVRGLTGDPILIAETGASPPADKPAKITNVFAGVQRYGLLGMVWFDSVNSHGVDFRVDSSAAESAFRKGASTYKRPGS